MATIEIRNRWTGVVLLTHETTDERVASGLAMRDALEKVVSAGASLSGADLRDADLRGASLSGADLSAANLRDANLRAANLRGANLRDANLRDADLSGANLRGANLRDADLRDANLRGANLSDAKWADSVVISQVPIQMSGLRWSVDILDQHMQIGCQLHPLHDWAAFDDAAIAAMDGRDALRFWRAHKDSLLSLARSAGRSFEPVNQPEASKE